MQPGIFPYRDSFPEYFGKNVLSQCQKFVSYFQGSYKAGAQLHNEIVEAFIMGGGLKSSV
ncbi:22124_t:CDS:2, partial [Entrophospora sp. SA101]